MNIHTQKMKKKNNTGTNRQTNASIGVTLDNGHRYHPVLSANFCNRDICLIL